MATPPPDNQTPPTEPVGLPGQIHQGGAGTVEREVPPLPEDATPDQIDEHWYRHVYQGDKMPQLTVRAVLMGGVLGMLMSASNLYTTLTIGWAFGVAITAVVMSYVIWTLVRALSFGRVSKMSVLENVCMASTASAAGYSTGSSIATMFGALLMMAPVPEGATPADVKSWDVHPFWLLASFTFVTGALGVFLAIPMKRQMINHERLPFPTGIAAAETLKSLYSQSRDALHKAYVLVAGLIAGGIVAVLNTGSMLGFLNDAFEWIRRTIGLELRLPGQVPATGFLRAGSDGLTSAAVGADGGRVRELIGFGFNPSVLLIAAGMIVGLRVSLSMLVGGALLYFFVAPGLIVQDAPNLLPDGSGFPTNPDYIESIEIVGGGTVFHVYRWGLWGGTALMVMASLTALALQWKTIARAFIRKGGAGGAREWDRIEVPMSWMIAGMVPLGIVLVGLQVVAFQIAWWAGIIAVLMSFVLSLVASRATGETDTTPTGAMGKVMQLLFAVLHPGHVVPNLASAGAAANSATSSADLLTDLKSGYLLGANPRKQFLAQFIGVFFGTLVIVPVWYLLVPDQGRFIGVDAYAAPATNQWYKVAEVLTKGIDQLPASARWSIFIGAMVGILLPLVERFAVPARFRKLMPSAMGLGLSWMLPFANAMAFAIGAVIAWIWSLIHKRSAEKFNVPLASGLVAGEALIASIIIMAVTATGLLFG